MTEDEMVGWHHQLDGHGFGWALGVGDGQGGLACCGPWGHKESDTTERVNSKFVVICYSSHRRLTQTVHACFSRTAESAESEKP